MNRRRTIKQLVIAGGGLVTLPQWMISCGISDSPVHKSSFSQDDQELLSSIADTIIPAGNSTGAIAVGVDKYLQKLIDDCFEKDVQVNVKSELKKLDVLAQSTNKKAFAECTQQQRQELLMKLSASNVKAEKDFFDLIKTETIRGFNTSQKVMQDFLGYKVAPGHYYGCIEVKT
jgi:hypothetical protein